MSRTLQLPYEAYATAFLQADLFLEYFFFCERKALPAQSRNGVKLASCDWSWRSHGSLIHGNSI